jgi:endonuclease/exonuclease/phosphatase family metal-dependent hydrolase
VGGAGSAAAGSGRTSAARPGARGLVWLLAGPAILITGIATGATGLAEAAPGWSVGVAAWIVAGATLLAVPLAAGPRRLTRHPMVAAALLVGGVAAAIVPRFRIDGIAGLAPSWAVAGQAAGALGLGAALGWVGAGADARAATAAGADRPARRGLAAGAGTLLFVVLTFGYYAPYDVDLGFPNVAVPVLAAIGIALAAVWLGPRARRWGAPAGPQRRLITLMAGALLCAGAVVGVQAWTAPARPTSPEPVADFPVRLAAYNIRMGFGLDGRFDPDALAATIRGQRPDLVLLSEVDRGWFLNGGHDDLQLIADRLGMRAVFAPAADQVWGDAMLTRLPLVSIRSHPLPRAGAPIGAQALAVVVQVGRHELAVVSTHLQPPPDGGPAAQAEEVARIAKRLADEDRPVVVAGDLNVEPRDPEFATLVGVAGLLDGLADARPLATYPSDRPVEEIDHVLITQDLLVTDVAAPESTASDHRAVAVTLNFQSPEELQPAD